MANFAMHELEENSCENKNEVLLLLYKNTSLLKELLSDGVMKAKYMNDVIALKIRMKELEAKEKIENFKIDDLISFLDTLTETLNIEENIQKNKKENTLSYKDITSKDSQNYYMSKENDTITVSRPSYIASRVCSAAIYATCKTFKTVTKGASKTLKRNYKKNI
jgi:Cft2 family RNA processing exonuclease